MNILIETRFGTGLLQRAFYPNGRLALRLVDYDDGSPIAILTVNLPQANLEPDEFCVKTWSENESIAQACMSSGFFKDTGKRFPTGHTVAEVWTFADHVKVENI